MHRRPAANGGVRLQPAASGYYPDVDRPLSPTTIAERYAIVAPLGTGATSRVLRAQDLLLQRPVALKLLRPCDDELAAARLRDEAVIASSLHHPGIARVFDYGEATVDGELRPYLAMQLVEGRTLRDILRDGPLPPEDVLRLVEQVAEALAHAHAAGVVHRDVKPGNIIVTPQGQAVLLDFGIARRSDLEPLTLTGAIVGTVDYLSAEQASGHSATPRSDLYSLGCVAYEAATGRRPFKRDTIMETVAAHATCEADPLPLHLPVGLRALVERLVRRDPAERPADAATVAELARHPELVATQLVTPLPRAAELLPAVHPAAARPAPARRPGIRAASGAAAAVAALAAVLMTDQIAPEGSPASAAGASTRAAPTPTQTPLPVVATVAHRSRHGASHAHHRRAAQRTVLTPATAEPAVAPSPARTARHHGKRPTAQPTAAAAATAPASPAHGKGPLAGPVNTQPPGKAQPPARQP